MQRSFNPRPRRTGGDTPNNLAPRSELYVSIRAPGEPGAIPAESAATHQLSLCFNPRPRRTGGDTVVGDENAPSMASFNPRPRRTGGDTYDVPFMATVSTCFNPRPRRTGGDTQVGTRSSGTTSWFQSAPPANRGRYHEIRGCYAHLEYVSIRAPGEPGAIPLGPEL